MRRLRSAVLFAILSAGCASVTPPQESRHRGDLLIDIAILHDLGFSERYVATYAAGRRVGHLLTSERRERHVTLPLQKVDELHALATDSLLDAESDTRSCHDCTSYFVVVRAGRTVHSFSGWMAHDAAHVEQALRVMGAWR